MNLGSLLACDDSRWDQLPVEGITEDSRSVKPGWLFVAVPGHTRDGTTYAHNAVERGALAIVSEQPLNVGVPVIVVPSARDSLADLAAAFYDNPTEKLDTFGVTGTDGKSTTCFFLRSILEASGVATGLMTTVETVVGGTRRDSSSRLTTPSAPLVQKSIADMAQSGDAAAVVECSSHALDQGRLRNVALKRAAITNIGIDHIEYHGSREAYAAAKWKITELLAPSDSPSLVLNADDPYLMGFAKNHPFACLKFGLSKTADVIGKLGANDPESRRMEICWNAQVEQVRIPIPGVHNAYNALAAAGIAVSIGIDLSTIACGLESARTPEGRLQQIETKKEFSVFVDYAHTEQAFEMVLNQLSQLARKRGGRLIAVFGAAGDRDRAKRTIFGHTAGVLCDYFVITTEDPYGENALSIIDEIASGAPAESREVQWTVEPDRRDAIRLALERARRGDIVVLTGKGHERSIVTGETAMPWSDIEVVQELLHGRA